MARRKNTRAQPLPKQMKHRSSYINKRSPQATVVVQGDTESTVCGGIIRGTRCKGFEQYYEYMDPGAATATLLHAKKTRTIMVIAGAGFAVKIPDVEEGEKAVPVEQPLSPGDVVEFSPGASYGITSTPTQQLEFFVVQEKAYNTHLKSTGEAVEGQEPEPEDVPENIQTTQYMEAVARDAPTPRRPRGQSKAAQQNQNFRGATNAGVHITQLLGRSPAGVTPGGAGPQASNTGTTHTTGVNPQPTNGV